MYKGVGDERRRRYRYEPVTSPSKKRVKRVPVKSKAVKKSGTVKLQVKKEVVKGVVKNTMKGVMKDSMKGVVKDSVKGTVRDSMKVSTKESMSAKESTESARGSKQSDLQQCRTILTHLMVQIWERTNE